MDEAGVEGKKTTKLLREHKRYITEAMSTFFDKKLLERLGIGTNEVEKVPLPDPAHPTTTGEESSPEEVGTGIVTTAIELEVYDYVRYRLPFLIARDEALFRKLDDIEYRDYKGTFAVSYKQVKKGRLFNFQEGTDTKYRFVFPETDTTINTDTLSDIDDELLAVFMRRVEELG